LGNDIGDPDLDPETSWNFDIGVKTRADRLQTTVSGFYNIVDDSLQAIAHRPPPSRRISASAAFPAAKASRVKTIRCVNTTGI
jgi:outer membrane receptor protein involved in Fe transport